MLTSLRRSALRPLRPLRPAAPHRARRRRGQGMTATEKIDNDITKPIK